MSLDLYNANLISIFLLALLLLLSYYNIQNLRKKNLSNFYKFFLFSRFLGILIIAILFLHPIISLSKQEKVSNTLNIYIDNSKSMGNNILIDDLKQILTNIKEWSIENNYILNYYTIGNSVRELNENLSDLDFSEWTFIDDLNDLSAGDYIITTVDENGCFDIAEFSISEPEDLSLSFDSSASVFALISSTSSLFVSSS